MQWIGDWLPLTVTIVAWIIFGWLLWLFKGARFLALQEEHTRLLKHHSTLLERIALAVEKAKHPSS
jgi:hypothetical protein